MDAAAHMCFVCRLCAVWHVSRKQLLHLGCNDDSLCAATCHLVNLLQAGALIQWVDRVVVRTLGACSTALPSRHWLLALICDLLAFVESKSAVALPRHVPSSISGMHSSDKYKVFLCGTPTLFTCDR